MDSFYLWTEQEPPSLTATGWETLFDDEAPGTGDRRHRPDRRPLPAAQQTNVPRVGDLVKDPLVEYLEHGFTLIGKWGEYELLRREGPARTGVVTTWVVTPVYRDTGSFRILRERLLEVLAADAGRRRAGRSASSSSTTPPGRTRRSPELEELDDVIVLQPPFNLGHQRGIVYALRKMLPRFADDDAVVTMDADGEDRPEDLPRLLAALDGGERRSARSSSRCGPNATSRPPSRSSTAASNCSSGRSPGRPCGPATTR